MAITRVQRPQIAAQVLGLWLLTGIFLREWTFHSFEGRMMVTLEFFFRLIPERRVTEIVEVGLKVQEPVVQGL